MFRIAICDDEVILCTQLEEYLEEYIDRGIVKTEVFYSADKLYEMLNNGEHYDLIFLDIEFQLTNGVEIGRKIRNELEDNKVQIVYISANQNYAMELFNIRPMNFLVKPILESDFIHNVDKAIELSQIYDSYFEFKFNSDNYRLPYGDILYFESSNRKINIHTKHTVNEMYDRLDNIEKNAPYNFIRIHKSYLVNKIYVIHWNSEKVTMINGCVLPVSQRYRKNMCKTLMRNERR